MKKHIITISICTCIVLIVNYYYFDLSEIKWLASYHGSGGPAKIITGDLYTETGGFKAAKLQYRQWQKDTEFWSLSGLIVRDPKPNTKVMIAAFSSIDNVTRMTHKLGSVDGDHENWAHRYTMRLSPYHNTIILEGHDKKLKYVPGQYYVVIVKHSGELIDFRAISSPKDITGIGDELVENFNSVNQFYQRNSQQ